MMENLLKRWWKKHIVDDFPWPECCWDCDLLFCDGCQEIKNEMEDL